MTRFYWDSQTWDNGTYYIDHITLSSQSDSPDDYVSSVSATYTGTRYELSWWGRRMVQTDYDVRYSTSSMKVNGWASGTSGGVVGNSGESTPGVFWQSPLMARASGDMYFAIKPTSSPTTSFYEIRLPLAPTSDFGGGGEPPTIITTSLPAGTRGTTYSQTLAATGGTTPYTWAVTSGSLPAGLSLNSSTGAITGTPTTAATSSFTVTVTDAGSLTDPQALSITINPITSGIDRSPSSDGGNTCSSRPCVFTVLASGSTATTGESANFLTAYNESQRGDTVKLEAGVIWPMEVTLGNPSGSSGRVRITSTRDSELPAAGTRITLAYLRPDNLTQAIVPLIKPSGNVEPAIKIGWDTDQGGASVATEHVELVGLGFYHDQATWNNSLDYSRGFLQVGDAGTLGVISDATTQQPDDIIVDRCVFTHTGLVRARKMIALNGRNVSVIDSFIEKAQNDSSDAQAIGGTSGVGLYTIQRNFLEGTAENVMFGGERPSYTSLTLENGASIKWNYLPHSIHRYRKTFWQAGMWVERGRIIYPTGDTVNTRIALNSGTTGGTEPTWCTTTSCSNTDNGITWVRKSSAAWLIKNNFEMKSAKALDIQYNVFDRNWVDGQETGVSLKIENEGLHSVQNGPPYHSGTVNTSGTTVTRVSGALPNVINVGGVVYTVESVDTSTNRLNLSDITGGVGRKVYLTSTGTLPAPLAANTVYYIAEINTTSDYVTLSATSGGSVIDITDSGSGTHSLGVYQVVGSVIRINGVNYTIASFDSDDQITLASSAGTQTGVAFEYGDDTSETHGGWLKNITFANNMVRRNPQGIKVSCGINALRARCGEITIRNNLFYATDRTLWSNHVGSAGSANSLYYHTHNGTGLVVANNTWIGTSHVYGMYFEGSDYRSTDAVFRNNVLSVGSTAGVRGLGTTAEGPTINAKFCGGSPCTTASWNRNLIAGVNTATYPASSTFSTALASAGFYKYQDYDGGRYRLRPGSTHYTSGTDGRALGVDETQLPMIHGLKVRVSDRAAIVDYVLTAVNQTIPCVLEVSTARDYTAPAGSLVPGVGTRLDTSDAHPARGWARSHVVTGLSASTTYWYRLQCGGEVIDDASFTTAATLSGTTTHTVRFPGASGSVPYGTTYVRSTDTISSGGTATASCSGGRCAASWTATRGTVQYYRLPGRPVSATTVQ
jgi:hypothetical protein